MSNADIFIRAYEEIENFLKGELRQPILHGEELIRQSIPKNIVVRNNEIDFYQLVKLRNLIVHEKRNGIPIADPADWAIQNITFLRNMLLNPPKVYPEFSTKVIWFQTTDPISKPLAVVINQALSQFPIFADEQLFGLLTTNTISRWLGMNIEQEIVSVVETQISDVLKFTEDTKNYVILPRDATVLKAIEKFREFQERGKRLEAVFISDGRPTKTSLHGVITISDLPKAYSLIQKPT